MTGQLGWLDLFGVSVDKGGRPIGRVTLDVEGAEDDVGVEVWLEPEPLLMVGVGVLVSMLLVSEVLNVDNVETNAAHSAATSVYPDHCSCVVHRCRDPPKLELNDPLPQKHVGSLL